jgi:hypothetical protein
MAKDLAGLIAIGMGKARSAKGTKPRQRAHSLPDVPPDHDTDVYPNPDPDDDGDDDRLPETDTDSDYDGADDGPEDASDDARDDGSGPTPEQVDCARDAIRALDSGDARALAEAILAIAGK